MGLLLLLSVTAAPLPAAQGRGSRVAAPATKGRCRSAVVEGEARAGQGMRRSFTDGLDVLLDPVAGGWVLRVLPHGEARLPEDYAELATPPFRSVSPLLLSTDFGFRSQDAVGWNPRHFRYAADARAFGRLEALFRRLGQGRSVFSSDEAQLGEVASAQPAGEMLLLDAGVAPGTGDASRAAAMLGTHFAQTAHRLEAPVRGGATPLGRIHWVRVRLTLQLRDGAAAAHGVTVVSTACGG